MNIQCKLYNTLDSAVSEMQGERGEVSRDLYSLYATQSNSKKKWEYFLGKGFQISTEVELYEWLSLGMVVDLDRLY